MHMLHCTLHQNLVVVTHTSSLGNNHPQQHPVTCMTHATFHIILLNCFASFFPDYFNCVTPSRTAVGSSFSYLFFDTRQLHWQIQIQKHVNKSLLSGAINLVVWNLVEEKSCSTPLHTLFLDNLILCSPRVWHKFGSQGAMYEVIIIRILFTFLDIDTHAL